MRTQTYDVSQVCENFGSQAEKVSNRQFFSARAAAEEENTYGIQK